MEYQNRLMIILAIIFSVSSFGYAENLWEQKCNDSTAYFQCSQTQPGYACLPNASADGLELQNVIGSNTSLEKKCACSNFTGYVEKDGECFDPTKVKKEAPKPGNITANQSGNNTAQGAANATNLTGENQQIPALVDGTNDIPMIELNKTEQKTENTWNINGQDLLATIIGAIAMIIASAVIVIVVMVVVGYLLLHFGKGDRL